MRAADVDYVRIVRPALLALLKAAPDESVACTETVDTLLAADNRGGWDRFISSAIRHGVLGVVHAQLARMPQLSETVRQTVLQRIAVEELWHQHLEQGLRRAMAALHTAGVQACALKGPVLARRLYSPPSARHSVDLDLLVAPDSLHKALAALIEIGYTAETGATAEYLLKYSHHVSLKQAGQPPIELHFRAYAGFGVEIAGDMLLARAQPFDLGDGVSVLVPPQEEEFVYLAAHAAGHSFIRLVWLYDLKLLCRQHPSLDWQRVADIAERYSVQAVVTYTLRLLDRWLDVSPSNVPPALIRPSLTAHVADWLLTEVSTPQPASARDKLGGLFFTSLLCDKARSSAWLWRHHLGRMTRRRLYRLAPVYFPQRWSG